MEKTVSQAKPTKAKKPSAAEQAQAVVAKIKQTALPLPCPTTAPGELAMVPLDLIDTRDQVRTVFFEETIAELAADIAHRGILQPLLLRPTPDGRFCVIAGERRYRAARLAQLTHVPALVGEIDEEAAELMQLAENIQREDLNAKDEATAIRKLFDKHQDLQAVADKVKKSKSWVCKRLAVSAPDYNWKVKNLLEEGLCQDFELLNTLNKGFEASWEIGCQMIERYQSGQLGRESARKLLKDLKRQEQEAAEAENERKAEKAEQAKARRELEKNAPLPWFDPINVHKWRADNLLTTKGITNATELIDELRKSADLVQEKLEWRLRQVYDQVKELNVTEAGMHLYVNAMAHQECYATRFTQLECVAGHIAASGTEFDLWKIIDLAIVSARIAAGETKSA